MVAFSATLLSQTNASTEQGAVDGREREKADNGGRGDPKHDPPRAVDPRALAAARISTRAFDTRVSGRSVGEVETEPEERRRHSDQEWAVGFETDEKTCAPDPEQREHERADAAGGGRDRRDDGAGDRGGGPRRGAVLEPRAGDGLIARPCPLLFTFTRRFATIPSDLSLPVFVRCLPRDDAHVPQAAHTLRVELFTSIEALLALLTDRIGDRRSPVSQNVGLDRGGGMIEAVADETIRARLLLKDGDSNIAFRDRLIELETKIRGVARDARAKSEPVVRREVGACHERNDRLR